MTRALCGLGRKCPPFMNVSNFPCGAFKVITINDVFCVIGNTSDYYSCTFYALACRHSEHRASCIHGARVTAKYCVHCRPGLKSLAAYCLHSFCTAQLGSPHNAVHSSSSQIISYWVHVMANDLLHCQCGLCMERDVNSNVLCDFEPPQGSGLTCFSWKFIAK